MLPLRIGWLQAEESKIYVMLREMDFSLLFWYLLIGSLFQNLLHVFSNIFKATNIFKAPNPRVKHTTPSVSNYAFFHIILFISVAMNSAHE